MLNPVITNWVRYRNALNQNEDETQRWDNLKPEEKVAHIDHYRQAWRRTAGEETPIAELEGFITELKRYALENRKGATSTLSWAKRFKKDFADTVADKVSRVRDNLNNQKELRDLMDIEFHRYAVEGIENRNFLATLAGELGFPLGAVALGGALAGPIGAASAGYAAVGPTEAASGRTWALRDAYFALLQEGVDGDTAWGKAQSVGGFSGAIQGIASTLPFAQKITGAVLQKGLPALAPKLAAKAAVTGGAARFAGKTATFATVAAAENVAFEGLDIAQERLHGVDVSQFRGGAGQRIGFAAALGFGIAGVGAGASKLKQGLTNRVKGKDFFNEENLEGMVNAVEQMRTMVDEGDRAGADALARSVFTDSSDPVGTASKLRGMIDAITKGKAAVETNIDLKTETDAVARAVGKQLDFFKKVVEGNKELAAASLFHEGAHPFFDMDLLPPKLRETIVKLGVAEITQRRGPLFNKDGVPLEGVEPRVGRRGEEAAILQDLLDASTVDIKKGGKVKKGEEPETVETVETAEADRVFISAEQVAELDRASAGENRLTEGFNDRALVEERRNAVLDEGVREWFSERMVLDNIEWGLGRIDDAGKTGFGRIAADWRNRLSMVSRALGFGNTFQNRFRDFLDNADRFNKGDLKKADRDSRKIIDDLFPTGKPRPKQGQKKAGPVGPVLVGEPPSDEPSVQPFFIPESQLNAELNQQIKIAQLRRSADRPSTAKKPEDKLAERIRERKVDEAAVDAPTLAQRRAKGGPRAVRQEDADAARDLQGKLRKKEIQKELGLGDARKKPSRRSRNKNEDQKEQADPRQQELPLRAKTKVGRRKKDAQGDQAVADAAEKQASGQRLTSDDLEAIRAGIEAEVAPKLKKARKVLSNLTKSLENGDAPSDSRIDLSMRARNAGVKGVEERKAALKEWQEKGTDSKYFQRWATHEGRKLVTERQVFVSDPRGTFTIELRDRPSWDDFFREFIFRGELPGEAGYKQNHLRDYPNTELEMLIERGLKAALPANKPLSSIELTEWKAIFQNAKASLMALRNPPQPRYPSKRDPEQAVALENAIDIFTTMDSFYKDRPFPLFHGTGKAEGGVPIHQKGAKPFLRFKTLAGRPAFNPTDKKRPPIFTSTDEDFAAVYDIDFENGISNLYNVYGRAKKVWDFWETDSLKAAQDYFGDATWRDHQGNIADMETISRGHWPSAESPVFQKFLYDNGYDAFVVQENGIRNIAFFDSADIKLAERGVERYDANEGDITARLVESKGIFSESPRVDESRRSGQDFRKVNYRRLTETVKGNPQGFTIDFRNQWPEGGYVVAPVKSTELVIPAGDLNPQSLRQYINKHYEVFDQPGAHFGGWLDKTTDRFVLDASWVLQDRDDAVRAALWGDQDAIYDIIGGDAVYTKNEGQPISPEGFRFSADEILQSRPADLVANAIESWRKQRGNSGADSTPDRSDFGRQDFSRRTDRPRARQTARRLEADNPFFKEINESRPDIKYYTPQSDRQGVLDAEHADSAERRAAVERLEDRTVESGNNFDVLLSIKEMEAQLANGDKAGAERTYAALAKHATSVAQMLNQMRYAKGKAPVAQRQLDLIEMVLAEKNRFLTDEQKTKIKTALDEDDTARIDYELKVQKALDDPSDDSINAALAAEEKAKKTYTEAMALAQSYLPALPLGRRLLQIIQGNLLTGMSLTRNFWHNYVSGTGRLSARQIGATIDALNPAKKGRSIVGLSVNEVGWWLRGTKRGFSQAKRIAKGGIYGQDIVGERIRSFQPWRAIKQLASGDLPMTVTSKGTRRMDWSAASEKIFEAAFGAAPEVMLRGLGVFDEIAKAGFRDARGAQELRALKKGPGTREYAQARLRRGEIGKFQEDTALRSTFQQNTGLASAYSGAEERIRQAFGESGVLVFRTLMSPYIRTPINVAVETASYAHPGIAGAEAVFHLKKAWDTRKQIKRIHGRNEPVPERLTAEHRDHSRSAHIAFGKVAVSMILGAIANYLLEDDEVITGGPENSKKLNKLKASTDMEYYRLNLDGLKRKMAGGDGRFRPGDTTVRLDMMGIPGVALGVKADITQLKDAQTRRTNPINNDLILSMLGLGRFMADTTMLLNVQRGLQALTRGDFGIYTQGLMQQYASIAPPFANSVTSMHVAADDENLKRDLYDPDPMRMFENVVAYKMGEFNDLPVKRDIWGRPLQNVPDGYNPFFYMGFRIDKASRGRADNRTAVVDQVFRQTKDPRIVPSWPGRSMTVNGDRIYLSNELYDSYIQQVQGAKMAAFDRIAPLALRQADPERALALIENAYNRAGNQAARRWKFQNRDAVAELVRKRDLLLQ